MVTAILATAAAILFLEAANTFRQGAKEKDATVGCVGVVFGLVEFVTAVGLTVLTVLANVLPWAVHTTGGSQ